MFNKKYKSTIFILLVLGAIQSSNSIPLPNPQNLGEIGVDVPTSNGGHRSLEFISGLLQNPMVQQLIQTGLGLIMGGGGGGARALNLGGSAGGQRSGSACSYTLI